jgi:tetratricopeptide (TPR) repeat protein
MPSMSHHGEYRFGAKRFPNNELKYYFNLSKIYQQNNQPEKAEKIFNDILKIDSNNFEAHFNLGKILLTKNKDDAFTYLLRDINSNNFVVIFYCIVKI